MGALVRMEVYVGKSFNAVAKKTITSKKKLLVPQPATPATEKRSEGLTEVEWGSLTGLPVDGTMLDEGVVYVRLIEGSWVGEDKCLGTASILLCEMARHEDVEEDSLRHGRSVELFGSNRQDVSQPGQEWLAGVGQASVRIVMVVRAADSAQGLLDQGRDAVNRREFVQGIRLFETAKERFLALHNTRMASQALDLIAEAERRRMLTVPIVTRRLALLQKHLALPVMPEAPRTSSLFLGENQSRDGGDDAAAGHAQLDSREGPQWPDNVCLVDFERSGMRGWSEGGTAGDEGSQSWLEEAADLIMDKRAFKRRMRGMARHLTLTDAEKALALLPPPLAAAMDQVTVDLIAAVDAHMGARNVDDANANVLLNNSNAGEDPLLFELTCQDQLQKNHVSHFTDYDGRVASVEDACQYVFDRPSHERPVYVVEGEAHGVGVSALMSKVTERLNHMMCDRKLPPRIITRFVGATEGSRRLETLLHSIILELRGLILLEGTLGDKFDSKSNSSGLQRLLQQKSPWFAKLRAKVGAIGGLTELCAELRDLAGLASAKKPLVLLIGKEAC